MMGVDSVCCKGEVGVYFVFELEEQTKKERKKEENRGNALDLILRPGGCRKCFELSI